MDEFEKEISAYVGCKAAAAMTAGTHALHIAIKLTGVQRGNIVLCSDLTFSATVNPVSYEGGVQVFIDSERETWNMNPEALEAGLKKYGKKVKALLLPTFTVYPRSLMKSYISATIMA